MNVKINGAVAREQQRQDFQRKSAEACQRITQQNKVS